MWPLRVTLLAALCLEARAVEKRWLGSADWRSPGNWDDGLVPETGSRIVFPQEMRHAVGMPAKGDLMIDSVLLSRDGIFALPVSGKIEISGVVDVRKSPRISRWLRDSPFFWVDPLNWNVSSEAVPHLERLPCQSDLVVLPSSSEIFSVRLPATRNVEVRAVRLADANRSLARWEWKHDVTGRAEFLRTDYGPTVKYSPLASCEDCHCQEGDLSDYWEEICNVQRPRCGLPACEYPLKVEGHCCYYCGGRIALSKKTLLSTARRVARSVLKAYEGTLDWHSRATWDGHNEILITEKQAYRGTETIIAVAEVVAALKEERANVLYSETSGDPLYDYRLAVALGPFLGGFLALLFLVLLLFPIFGYSYSQVWEASREVGAAIWQELRSSGAGSGSSSRKRKQSIAFARFENVHEGSVQLAEEEAATEARGETFENPLYSLKDSPGVKGEEDKKKLDLNEPVSLVALENASRSERTEEIEMDIENF